MGEVEEDELGDDGNADCSYAFDDEEPSPAVNSVSTIKSTCDAAGEETTESPRQDRSAVENGKAFT